MNPLMLLAQEAAAPPDVEFTGHVVLVRLPIVSHYLAFSAQTTPPLGIAYLAACLEREKVPVTLIDTVAEGLDCIQVDGAFRVHGLTLDQIVARIPEDATIIGISCLFSQEWPWHRQIIAAIRQRFPAALIVAGGEHISALSEFCLRDCPSIDVCAVGEGEETIVELVRAHAAGSDFARVQSLAFLRDGEFIATPRRSRIRDVDALPWPAWHLLPMEAYVENPNMHGVYTGRRSMPLLATRGCPYKCTFCTNPSMYGVSYFTRKPSDVLDEIQAYMRDYDASNFLFYDLTFVLKRSWVLDFCRQIEARGLKFTWQLPTGTRSEVIDDEVAAALRRTGCNVINYAPESGSEETLKLIKKQVNLDHLLESVRASLRQGMKVKCMLIIGFPHETRRHVIATVRYSWKMAVAGVHDQPVFTYAANPGGELFDDLRKDGSIPRLDDEFFQSLCVYTNPFNSKNYNKHLSWVELAFWRFFTIASFYSIQFAMRPRRFVALLMAAWSNRYATHTEQRFGQSLRRALGLTITRSGDRKEATVGARLPARRSTAVASGEAIAVAKTIA